MMLKRIKLITRRALLLPLFLLCWSFLGCKGQSDTRGDLHQYLPVEKGLNVIVVSFDALRADALGVYNPRSQASPNIDLFASESLVFDQAHSAAQSTPTSFAATFTGVLPFRSFVKWKMVEVQTLAGYLRSSGYVTSLITDNVQVNKERHFDQGFDYFTVIESSDDEDMIPQVLAHIDKHKGDKFFSWYHFLSPHAPYDYREISAHFYDQDYEGRFKKTVPVKYQLESNDEIAYVKQLYDGEVFYLDHIFSRIIGKIKDVGLLNNTVIVFTSDHGEEFLEHGGTEHDSLFEEVLRIPLIVRHPHALKAGRTSLPYSNVDLFPTLSGLLGIPCDIPLDGVDLGNTNLEGREKIAFAMTKSEKIEVSIQQREAKLIESCTPKKQKQTFDLNDDLLEQVNLGEAHPLTKELARNLREKIGGDPCKTIELSVQGVAPTEGLSKEQINKLKSLGYIK